MSDGRGRKPTWSAKQAKRVLELAAEGMSQRAIAKEVFGNARLHGRVERIVGAQTKRTAVSEGEPLDVQSVLPEDLEAPELRKLFSFYDQIRQRTGAEPSLADIERLLRINLQLETLAQVERLNAMVSESGLDGGDFLDALGKA